MIHLLQWEFCSEFYLPRTIFMFFFISRIFERTVNIYKDTWGEICQITVMIIVSSFWISLKIIKIKFLDISDLKLKTMLENNSSTMLSNHPQKKIIIRLSVQTPHFTVTYFTAVGVILKSIFYGCS